MLRHAELVQREGGSCVMVSLNWCGFSSRAGAAPRTPTWRCTATATASACCRAIRCSASPSRPTRRCGAWPASTTCTCTACRASSRRPTTRCVASARDCLTPLADARRDDTVMPAFSSGPVGRHVPPTCDAVGQRRPAVHVRRRHPGAPDGPGGRRASIRQAWAAVARRHVAARRGAHARRTAPGARPSSASPAH